MVDVKASIAPLNGKNYPTWKIQCKMALMKDGLWGIASGTEDAPAEDDAEARRKYTSRKDRALVIIVLGIDPSLLYLLGNPENPSEVWTQLQD